LCFFNRMHAAILTLGLVIFLGHLLSALFRRTRIPDVLLLVGLGIALGPVGLHWVMREDFGRVGPVLTSIALIVILFEGGLGLSLASLRKGLVDTSALTFASAAATMALVAYFAQDHLGFWPALILGGILSGTSSAVVLPMVAALPLHERSKTVLALESALTDVLTIVVPFGLLPLALGGEMSGIDLARDVTVKPIMASILGIAGGIVWLYLQSGARRLPHFFSAVFAFVFVLYGAIEVMEFSGAVTALVAGVVISNPPGFLRERLQRAAQLEGRAVGEAISAFDRSIYAEVVFLMKLFFFVYLGLTLQFESARPYVVAGTLVAAIYAARTVLTRFTFPRELPARDAGVAAVMAPKGLAAAVIASAVAEQLPEIGPQLKELTFAVVLVSIVATSVLVPLVDVPGVRGVVGWWFGGYRPR